MGIALSRPALLICCRWDSLRYSHTIGLGESDRVRGCSEMRRQRIGGRLAVRSTPRTVELIRPLTIVNFDHRLLESPGGPFSYEHFPLCTAQRGHDNGFSPRHTGRRSSSLELRSRRTRPVGVVRTGRRPRRTAGGGGTRPHQMPAQSGHTGLRGRFLRGRRDRFRVAKTHRSTQELTAFVPSTMRVTPTLAVPA